MLVGLGTLYRWSDNKLTLPIALRSADLGLDNIDFRSSVSGVVEGHF